MKRSCSLLLFGLLVVLPVHGQQRFDAIQLLTDVRVLASDSLEGRQTGTPGAERARAYIAARMTQEGLLAFGSGYEQAYMQGRENEEGARGINVVGYVQGTDHPDRYLVLSAHYDHLGIRHGAIYNGADDNASGVAGLLAAAAYFNQHRPRHSIIFAAFDAEEAGLKGARAFVLHPPVDRAQLLLDVNLDMISRNEKDELFASGTAHYPVLKPTLEKIAARSRVHLRFGHDQPRGAMGDDWTSSSDHGPFHQAGIPFVYFGVEDHADYHQETDEYARIDPAFFIRAVDTILQAVEALDATLEDRSRSATH